MNVTQRGMSALSAIGLAAGALYAAGAAPVAAETVTEEFEHEDASGSDLTFTLPGDPSNTCDVEIVAHGSNGESVGEFGTAGHAAQVLSLIHI